MKPLGKRPKSKSFGCCTHNDVIAHVTKIGKAEIYAGAIYDFKNEIDRVDRPTIVVSATVIGNMSGSKETQIDGIAKKALKRTTKIRCAYEIGTVQINWGDGETPPESVEWFDALTKDISEFDGDVVFCCTGGHGRTGTALAAVIHLSGVLKGKDIIKWLRKNYCAEVVESEAQIKWLISEVGLKTGASPTKKIQSYNTAAYKYEDAGAPKLIMKSGNGTRCDSCNKKNFTVLCPSGLAYCDACYGFGEKNELPHASQFKSGTCDDCGRSRWVGVYEKKGVNICNGCENARTRHIYKAADVVECV